MSATSVLTMIISAVMYCTPISLFLAIIWNHSSRTDLLIKVAFSILAIFGMLVSAASLGIVPTIHLV